MNGILIPALPLIVLITALLLKRGAVVSPLAGGAAVAALVFLDARFALDAGALLAADLPVVLILTLSVALVVVPGQMLNALLQSSGVIAAIGARIGAIPLSRMQMASLIVLGIAPALESMTGFGVSLFFSVPVLMQLFSVNKALLLSLLSMNIMPWGTLALATQVGAQLSGTPFSQLAFTTSLTSFAVFPVIGLLVFIVCRKPGDRWRALAWPLLTGLLLSCCLVFYNAHAAAELAGVYAGLTTAAMVLVGGVVRGGAGLLAGFVAVRLALRRLFGGFVRGGPGLLAAFVSARPVLLRLFAPYLTLIALVGISRIAPVHDALQSLPGFQSGDVKLSVFASPGVFIFLTIALMCACSKTCRNPGALRDGIRRAVYPVTATMLFVLFAQLHRASGIFEDLASRMVALGASEMTFIAPLLGMLSGYATGSNIGGNTLFMPLQSDAGRHFEQAIEFAALQNSSAGHAVFLSLPIVLLAVSIAGGGLRGGRGERGDGGERAGDGGRGGGRADSRADARARQAWLIRRALLCALPIYAALVVGFWGVVG